MTFANMLNAPGTSSLGCMHQAPATGLRAPAPCQRRPVKPFRVRAIAEPEVRAPATSNGSATKVPALLVGLTCSHRRFKMSYARDSNFVQNGAPPGTPNVDTLVGFCPSTSNGEHLRHVLALFVCTVLVPHSKCLAQQ